MSESRKKDHIELTFKSRPESMVDQMGLYYEPLFSAHPSLEKDTFPTRFMGYDLKLPLWVSSMTGGTGVAKNINKNLARAAGEFGLGMGLGSCRSLLDTTNQRFSDFDVKSELKEFPLFSNFGIAQLEELIEQNSIHKVFDITKNLNADGIIIHVNPLQEWAQPEGDRYKRSALETIESVVSTSPYPIIVKEVGQGFGPKSLEALCKMPLAAVEFAGLGGTNFTILELSRLNASESGRKLKNTKLGLIGHTPLEMVGFINNLDPAKMKCKNFIISGGITSALEGYILMQELKYPAVIGMASEFLKYAMNDYETLRQFVLALKDELLMANAFLRKM